jgi:hypothetical protein
VEFLSHSCVFETQKKGTKSAGNEEAIPVLDHRSNPVKSRCPPVVEEEAGTTPAEGVEEVEATAIAPDLATATAER